MSKIAAQQCPPVFLGQAFIELKRASAVEAASGLATLSHIADGVEAAGPCVETQPLLLEKKAIWSGSSKPASESKN